MVFFYIPTYIQIYPHIMCTPSFHVKILVEKVCIIRGYLRYLHRNSDGTAKLGLMCFWMDQVFFSFLCENDAPWAFPDKFGFLFGAEANWMFSYWRTNLKSEDVTRPTSEKGETKTPHVRWCVERKTDGDSVKNKTVACCSFVFCWLSFCQCKSTSCFVHKIKYDTKESSEEVN